MAIIHRATLNPSKLELLQAFLPNLDAIAAHVGDDLSLLGAYRFDDPAGVAGIETHLLSGLDGLVLHIPVTYRSVPLEGADEWVVGTTEHSVLGSRLVYFGAADPVYRTALATTIVSGGTQVREMVQTDDGEVERDPSAQVAGSGAQGALFNLEGATASFEGTNLLLDAAGVRAAIRLVVNPTEETSDAPHLAGTWTSQQTPVVLATINTR